MSNQWPPPSQDDSGADRRRAFRHPFNSECELSIISPAWAATATPFVGATENITLYGVRVANLPVDPRVVRMWEAGLRDETDLQVTVAFPVFPSVSPIRGTIVWIDKRTEAEGHVSVGVLFGVLSERERDVLDGLIRGLHQG